MHKRLLFILFLSFSIMVAASFGCGRHPSGETTVLSIANGDVFIMKANTTTWVKAQVGVTLKADDTIKAGDDSWAMITFFEGSTIELEPGTEVSVAALNITDTGSTTIGLQQEIGKTVSRVNKLADPASSYEVNTPTGVAAVRGSVMLVDVAEDGTTTVGNGEGSIAVIAQGVEVQIPQGMQSVVAIGQQPSVPEQGLPFVPSGIVGNTASIITSAGAGGSMSPSGLVTVSNGADQTFTITPNAGYYVADVLVDGVSVGAVTSYTFSNVTANHIISASFAIITHTITASASAGGSISPLGDVTVNYGADQAFTITPDTGYNVTDVLVDGVSIGAVTSYAFSNVTANHTISATFAISTYTYTAVDDFSIENGNPNGAWSYGWMPTDFSSFNLYENTYLGTANSPYWYAWGADRTPGIWENLGSLAYGVPTGWLSLHPGNGYEPSVLRWTALVAGTVRVTGQFLPGDWGVMQVAVRLDNQPWWQESDSGNFDLTTNVTSGTTIDFAVYGGYGYGNTPISATINYIIDT